MTARRFAVVVFLVIAAGCSSKDSGPTGPTVKSGDLIISTLPNSAYILLDGSESPGSTGAVYTPVGYTGIASGSHTIHLSMAGYAETTLVVAVPSGGVFADTIPLRPLTGTPRSLAEVWPGRYLIPGPICGAPNGNLYATGKLQPYSTSVLSIVASDGTLISSTAFADPDMNPALDMDTDSQSRAYIASTYVPGRVYVHSSTGVQINTILQAPYNQPFNLLYGVAVGPGDTLHVLTSYAQQPVVEKYTLAGFAYRLPVPNAAGNQSVASLEVDASGTIYVVGNFSPGPNPGILRMDRSGTALGTWALPAHALTGFSPQIRLAADGSLFISYPATSYSSSDARRIQAPGIMRHISSTGAIIGEWGIENSTLLYMQRHGMDAAGNIYVPMHNGDRVWKFSF